MSVFFLWPVGDLVVNINRCPLYTPLPSTTMYRGDGLRAGSSEDNWVHEEEQDEARACDGNYTAN